MAEKEKNQLQYKVECIDDKPAASDISNEPDRLAEDPLDHLPDVSSQTGGLPVVTFVLICLSACAVLLISRMLSAGSLLAAVFCVLMEVILVFGVIALIRGMFQKLRNQNETPFWYPFSAAVMVIGIAAGIIIGVVFCF